MIQKFVLGLSFLALSFNILMADDRMMLKNGDELSGKVVKISDKEISFSVNAGSRNGNTNSVYPTQDVYMIKTEKRGTIFFINGDRIIRETIRPDKSADYIYLLSGEEIPAWKLSLNNGVISYQKDKLQKRAMSNIGAFPVEEVFLVKYNDGSKDIFTEFSEVPSKNSRDKEEENQILKVVFYDVVKGDTLGSIAEKFGVRVDQIKLWNELPDAFNSGTSPKAGSQLLLQVKQ